MVDFENNLPIFTMQFLKILLSNVRFSHDFLVCIFYDAFFVKLHIPTIYNTFKGNYGDGKLGMTNKVHISNCIL